METAKRFNKGKTRWSEVDFKALEPMVKVLEYGRDKYSEFKDPSDGKILNGFECTEQERESWERIYDASGNWKKGFVGMENMESALRHIFAYMDGEKIDSESGLPHLGHALACLMFQSYHEQKTNENESI